jgi:formylglycine-generating enzyme required for sulfatase activity
MKSDRDDTLRLYIATQQGAQPEAPAPTGRVRAWFQKLRRRLTIQEMGQAADKGSPLRDYVMLHYLSGRQGKALTPYVPKALLTLLFPKGQPWLRFRPGFLAVAAAMVSALLWWWLDPAPTPVPSAIVAVGFLEESNDVIVKRENGLAERWVRKDHALALSESGPESLFTDPLAKVKMGELTASDPDGHVKLDYRKEGQLLVITLGDDQELAREAVPPAQVASLHWPAGADAYLVVARTVVPELVTLSGLGNLRQQVIASRQEKQAADAKAKEEKLKAEEAKRLAAIVPKKKAIEAAQSVGPEKQLPPQTKPTKVAEAPTAAADMKQSGGPESAPSQSVQSERPEADTNEKLPSRIIGKDGAPMVLVPAGEFLMGSGKDSKSAQDDERPAHRVYRDDYYIDQYEVTTARYAKFFQETKWREPYLWSEQVLKQHTNKPVVGVDWNDAVAYCSWAGKRLPTEAEWEKAARGTDQRMYPWGDQAPTDQRANFDHCCDFKDYGALTEVGSFEGGKSPYGAYDMAGNVWEWVADWYDEHYYGKSPEQNPKGPSTGIYRVIRGGSWGNGPESVRSADRCRAHSRETERHCGVPLRPGRSEVTFTL